MSNLFENGKGSQSLGSKFFSWTECLDILSFQPNLISILIYLRWDTTMIICLLHYLLSLHHGFFSSCSDLPHPCGKLLWPWISCRMGGFFSSVWMVSMVKEEWG